MQRRFDKLDCFPTGDRSQRTIELRKNQSQKDSGSKILVENTGLEPVTS